MKRDAILLNILFVWWDLPEFLIIGEKSCKIRNVHLASHYEQFFIISAIWKIFSYVGTMKKTEETSSNRKKPLSNHCAIIGKSGSGSTFQSSSYVARSAADSRRRYGRDPPAATNWSFQWKSYDDLMIIAIRVGGSNFATTQTRGHFYVRFTYT